MASAQALFSRRKSTELLVPTMQSVIKKIRKNTCENQIRKVPSNYYGILYCIFTYFFLQCSLYSTDECYIQEFKDLHLTLLF